MTQITPEEQREAFTRELSKGVDFEAAAWLAGLEPNALARELVLGRNFFNSGKVLRKKTEKESAEFYKRFQMATMQARAKAIKTITASEDWKAAKFWLEANASHLYGGWNDAPAVLEEAQEMLEIEAQDD